MGSDANFYYDERSIFAITLKLCGYFCNYFEKGVFGVISSNTNLFPKPKCELENLCLRSQLSTLLFLSEKGMRREKPPKKQRKQKPIIIIKKCTVGLAKHPNQRTKQLLLPKPRSYALSKLNSSPITTIKCTLYFYFSF